MGPSEVERRNRGIEAQRRVDRRRVRLLEIGGRCGGEPQRIDIDAGGRRHCGTGGFGSHGGGVLVERGDRAGARTPALAKERSNRRLDRADGEEDGYRSR